MTPDKTRLDDTGLDDDRLELEESLAVDEHVDLPLRRSDLHTRVIFALVRQKVDTWTPAGPDAAKPPTDQRAVPTAEIIAGIMATPLDDEDATNLTFAKRATFTAVEKLPLVDDPRPFASAQAAYDVIEGIYRPILPTCSTVWADPTSDRAVELMALQGLGSHRLHAVSDDPEGAAYVIDVSFLHAYPVRAGYLRYGACAWFTADGCIQRIHTSHDDVTHHPGDPGWEHAKWVWRTSLFTAVTVADHLGSTHYLTSNALVTVARRTLPPDHPLRRLVKLFTYGTVDINRDAALGLSNEGGIAHRLFAFTYPGLARLLLRGIETRRMQTFPEAIAAMQADSLGESFRYAADGLALYRLLGDFVQDYLSAYFSDDELVTDPAIRAFWRELSDLAPTLSLPPLSGAAQLKDFLTQFMFWVTGGHQQVGGVVDYLDNHRFVGAKLAPGLDEGDAQTTVQLMNLTIFTGLEQPPMIGDYRHLFLDERGVAAFDRYQAALVARAEAIAARNATIDQPYRTFDPTILDTSVST